MHTFKKEAIIHMPTTKDAQKLVFTLMRSLLEECYALSRSWPMIGDKRTHNPLLPEVLTNAIWDIIRDYLEEEGKMEAWLASGDIKTLIGRWWTLLRDRTKKADKSRLSIDVRML